MSDAEVPVFGGRDESEESLPSGDVTEAVVRVGPTVRRPAQPQSAAVAGYLQHLRAAGFGGAPRYLGRDHVGRDVLDYLEGDVAGDPPEAWAAGTDLLVSVGVLLRRLHEASAGFGAERGFAAPPGASWFTRPLPGVTREQLPAEPAPELVSHNDVTPQNVVVRDGLAVGLIDFDMAGPTTREIDFYTTAMFWVPLRDPVDVWPTWAGLDQPDRLRRLADAYGVTAKLAHVAGRRRSVPLRPELAADEGRRRAFGRWLGPHVGGGRRRPDPPPAGMADRLWSHPDDSVALRPLAHVPVGDRQVGHRKVRQM